MRIVTWNINGLKSSFRNGISTWLSETNADLVCLQETKLQPDLLLQNWFDGYRFELFPAERSGYSGVGILIKENISNLSVEFGIPNSSYNTEGRVLRCIFPEFELLNIYAPHSHRDLRNLPKKEKFCQELLDFVSERKENQPPLILVGDLNVAPEERDLHNFKQNRGNAGFHEMEREWFSKLLGLGFTDSFRMFEAESGHYTWWSLLPGVKERNVGWRLDHILVANKLVNNVTSCNILPEVTGSDHCPVSIVLEGLVP